ncbi:MAG: hypothetical protein GF398_04625 [Chitinivibrionales bacterium]|nr:hypothetical protein [Chitinivibrionales bacterium]
MHTNALGCINLVFKEDFKEAEKKAKSLIRENPDHPSGYFFYASVLNYWMIYYQSTRKENLFYQQCDRAIEKANILLKKNKHDYWALFFKGGAEGIKGTYEARFERWITAFRNGWKGYSLLSELAEKNNKIFDAHYGLGSYEYWRSSMTKKLKWMPGIGDKRAEGMQKIKIAMSRGKYTRLTAHEEMIKVYLNEKAWSKAEQLSIDMLEKYPGAVLFTWYLAEAQYHLGKLEKAEDRYKYLLGRVEAESYDNHYNAALCHYWLAKIYYNLKRYTQCVAECNRMRYYKFTVDIQKRLESELAEADKLRKQAEQARK